ncbi:hypothetical protein [Chryseobacterium arthrosphaerae]|uniref:Uncharacterized protein n=1 Tax=Chryseobacterium arthrosphaerae TaxID=651561 RepID=A0A1B8ZAV0_9FLAO|nr:hypothetical protein [Chryseobacterium arthrosphaerae]OCA68722.1 hypothetical protein BBI00_21190 [Chryseobacterium arthrosphaerae]
MNTSKDNLEFQIKKQIDEREIAPSRDLWSEIELQNTMNAQSKFKINRLLMAACLILAFSLGTVLYFLSGSSETQPQIVETAVHSSDQQHIVKEPAQNNVALATRENGKKEVKKIASPQETETISALAVDEKKVILKDAASDKKLVPIQISNPKIIAKADSAKIPGKKKKYVDPSTLLFSVEHKDVIEKTKDGSNVATIELNAK